MKSRFTIAAALALAAATILTVAACGSAVSGSAQANSAAETSSSVSGGSSTSARSSTTAGTTGGKASVTAVPTDLSELTALLSDLPTNVTLPSDLTIPTDFSIPSELTDLNIPGYNSACLSVYSAYASISLALLPALLGGNGSFDAGSLQSALSSIGGNVPPELAPDIQELSDVAAAANGKSLSDASQLFEDPKFTAAQQHIEDWTTANCGG
jgi:hypothetical protein